MAVATVMGARVVAVQGVPGCFSHQAAALLAPGSAVHFCTTMEQAFASIAQRAATSIAVPVHNTSAGDIAPHIALVAAHPELRTRGHAVMPVRMHLLAMPGATLEGIRLALSHPVALKQCSQWLQRHGSIRAEEHFDTAGAAEEVARRGDPAVAAVAGEAAARAYGLQPLARDIHDTPYNATRFLLLSR